LAVFRRLRFNHLYVGKEIITEDGRRFRIFRHLSRRGRANATPSVLVVRFRFTRFSHRVNRALSFIPVPLIGGFPGFRHKLWMVADATGEWQGIYEWESDEAARLYRQSFVLRLMNRRADPGSITSTLHSQVQLADYLEVRII
jgi:hypothetical protein